MAITRSKRRAWRGGNKLRRTLRRLEPEITKEIKDDLERGANNIANDAAVYAYSLGLYDTGDMIDSIEVNMGRDGLTAVIGPGAKRIKISKSPFNTTLYVKDKDKHAALQFFKAYWAEFGTKGAPNRNIPPQPATPFMNPSYDANKGDIMKDLDKSIGDALRIASSMTTDA